MSGAPPTDRTLPFLPKLWVCFFRTLLVIQDTRHHLKRDVICGDKTGNNVFLSAFSKSYQLSPSPPAPRRSQFLVKHPISDSMGRNSCRIDNHMSGFSGLAKTAFLRACLHTFQPGELYPSVLAASSANPGSIAPVCIAAAPETRAKPRKCQNLNMVSGQFINKARRHEIAVAKHAPVTRKGNGANLFRAGNAHMKNGAPPQPFMPLSSLPVVRGTSHLPNRAERPPNSSPLAYGVSLWRLFALFFAVIVHPKAQATRIMKVFKFFKCFDQFLQVFQRPGASGVCHSATSPYSPTHPR